MDKDTVCSVPPIQQMALSREHVKPALCSVLQIPAFSVFGLVSQKAGEGKRKTKQASVSESSQNVQL